MTQESKTEIDFFVAGLILFSFIAFIAYFAAFAKDEGAIGAGYLANFIADYLLYISQLFLLDTFFLPA